MLFDTKYWNEGSFRMDIVYASETLLNRKVISG